MRERLLLSLFFLLHFGSIGVFLLPAEPDSLSMFPPAVAEPMEKASARAVDAAWPVARRYLSATATRQHWALFAPGPSRWFSSIDAVAWYPSDSTEGGGWTADTVRLSGSREDPLPHFLKKRHYRIHFNLGYEASESLARPVFARALCRRLTDDRGRSPDGVSLSAEWERIRVPWQPSSDPDLYRQFLGGYTCPGYQGSERMPMEGGAEESPPEEPGREAEAPAREGEGGG